MALAQTPAASPTSPSQSSPQTSVSPARNATDGSIGNAKDKVTWTDLEAMIPMMGFGLQIVISIAGFTLVWWQIKQLNRSIAGDTHSKLYDHYLKVTELLSQKPALRPFFYEGVELERGFPGYADLRAEIEMTCEIILGLLEHAAVQEKNLPKETWETCWKAYTHERFEKSPELQKFFKDNRKWYAEPFRKVVGSRFRELI